MTGGARSGDFYGFAPRPAAKPSRVSGRARSLVRVAAVIAACAARMTSGMILAMWTPW
jgi:hypothetical protein